jgi:hypothetical protein
MKVRARHEKVGRAKTTENTGNAVGWRHKNARVAIRPGKAPQSSGSSLKI